MYVLFNNRQEHMFCHDFTIPGPSLGSLHNVCVCQPNEDIQETKTDQRLDYILCAYNYIIRNKEDVLWVVCDWGWGPGYKSAWQPLTLLSYTDDAKIDRCT